MHTQVRLIEMSSRWVYEWDEEKGEWNMTVSDAKVSDKFNKFAQDNNVNPVSHFIVPTHDRSNNGKTLTITTTLSASVIDRVQQAQMELAYREQTAKLGASLAPPVTIPTNQVAEATSPQASTPPVTDVARAAANTVAPPPPSTPNDNPLEPVDVNALGEASPVQ